MGDKVKHIFFSFFAILLSSLCLVPFSVFADSVDNPFVIIDRTNSEFGLQPLYVESARFFSGASNVNNLLYDLQGNTDYTLFPVCSIDRYVDDYYHLFYKFGFTSKPYYTEYDYGTFHVIGHLQTLGNSRTVNLTIHSADANYGSPTCQIFSSDGKRDIGTYYVKTNYDLTYTSATDRNYIRVNSGDPCYFDLSFSVNSLRDVKYFSVNIPITQTQYAFNGSGGWQLVIDSVYFVNNYSRELYALYNVVPGINSRLDQLIANTSQSALSQSSSQQLQSSSAQISGDITRLDGLENSAYGDFTSAMYAFSPPSLSGETESISFVTSIIGLWWQGLGAFQVVLFLALALIVFNFIARYKGS